MKETAFRLPHATDAHWEYTGLSLSALKRLFPVQFVVTKHSVCSFCSKKGHSVAACPLSSADYTSPPGHVLSALLTQDLPPIRVPEKFTLAAVTAEFIEHGTALNADNPFADRPNTSVHALPKRLGFWKAIRTPRSILTWLAFGYQLRFIAPPPMVGFDNHPGAFQYALFIDEELTKRVTRGQFSIVDATFAKQIHPMDVVPKASGGYRLILDCRLINGFLPQIPFKLENLSVVPQVIARSSWLFSTDLEDAYFHIPVHPSSSPHLCFQWRGRIYSSNVVPFGLSIAPWIFTKVLRPVIRYCRLFGISVVAYLDDFLWSDSKPNIAALVDFARALLTWLGFAVSEKKSEWTPTQCLQFLGLLVDAERFEFSIPPEKIAKIVRAVNALLAKAEANEKITATNVAVVCGHILAIRLACAPARIYTRALYAVVNQAEYWEQRIVIPSAARDELKFWSVQLPNYKSLGMVAAPTTIRLNCDASDDGWGAHTSATSAFGYFDPDLCAPYTSSTFRELLGLLHAIRSPTIARAIAGQRVMFILDSMAGVRNLLKGGGPVPELSDLVKQIWTQCIAIGTDASADWVRRDRNERADVLSKFRDSADWMLNPELFAAIDRRWGVHSVDRFAVTHNTQCTRFSSKYYDPNAEAIDAFDQDWSTDNNYCNPNFVDIPRVLAHAQRQRASLTLICPDWPSAIWYKTLRTAASDYIRLPAFQRTFIPGPRSAHTVLNAPNWSVLAVRVSFANRTATEATPRGVRIFEERTGSKHDQ